MKCADNQCLQKKIFSNYQIIPLTEIVCLRIVYAETSRLRVKKIPSSGDIVELLID